MWFKNLFGFDEESPGKVRSLVTIEGSKLLSKANGRTFEYGTLEVVSLEVLKKKATGGTFKGKLKLRELVGDVRMLHTNPENKQALFQAASQFNLLEMVHPNVTPEQGIDLYERDRTQGPACAIACGAGTLFRNYLVTVNGQTGQSKDNQIDCLSLIGEELKNAERHLWEMRNGYAIPGRNGLLTISKLLGSLSGKEREQLKEKLRIGIQWNTEVTLNNAGHLVSQIYCSALPVAYSSIESAYWEPFARIVLEAAYEATFYAALINLEKTGCNKVFLTLLGGGAFGNETEWITDALKRTILLFQNTPLDISIVSYGQSSRDVNNLISQLGF